MLSQSRKYGQWIAVAVVGLFVFNNPEGAAEVVRNAFALLSQAGDSLAAFVGELQ